MVSHRLAAFALVLAASIIAAVFDVRTRRIPNVITIALVIGGLAINALSGVHPLLADVLVTAAALAIGTVIFSLKLAGGGDVKLLASACGVLGPASALSLLLSTFLCGGLIAVCYALLRGRLRASLAGVRTMALPMFYGASPVRIEAGTSMPYALAICAGAVLTYFAHGTALLRLPW
jgi:prepilin peptidase CpaA